MVTTDNIVTSLSVVGSVIYIGKPIAQTYFMKLYNEAVSVG